MSDKFNLVKKPKKDNVIDDYEDGYVEVEEDKDTNKKAVDAKKRMFTMMGFIVGGMVVLLLVLYIVSVFSNKTYTYSQIEEILREAAISYFKDNPTSLPANDGDLIEIDSSNLVVAEKMKPLTEYTGENVPCTATVHVEKAGNEYLYTPYLSCGDKYTTEELYKKLTKSENIVSEGYGLYAYNGGYAYRGEEVNNYVKLGDNLWRIVKITSDNNIVLINQTGITYDQPWDNRYNEAKFYDAGFNNYNTSRIKEYLTRIYSKPIKDDGEDILSKKDKAKIISYDLCIGKRDANSERKDNTEECSVVSENQKYGLLTLSDYLYASTDPNCKNSLNKSCQNYNYLVLKDYSWWLATADKSDDAKIYSVNRSGVVESAIASNYYKIRPVIYLNNKVLYKSGNGSLEKPFKIKD